MNKIVFLIAVIFIQLPAFAERTNCSAIKKGIEADLAALTTYMDCASPQLKTKSTEPLEMVKEWVAKAMPDAEYDFRANDNTDSISGEDSIAGTCSKRTARDAILQTAETWYATSEHEDGSERDNLPAIRKATDKLLKRVGLRFGFAAGDQGWGGSPATNVVVLHPECHLAFGVFLGITHD